MHTLLKPAAIASLALVLSGCTGLLGSVIKPDMSGSEQPSFGDQTALKEKADALPQSGTIDFLCGDNDAWMKTTFFGGDQMISVTTVHSLTLAPQVLECRPTRAGPNCTAGTLQVIVQPMSDRLNITESTSGLDMLCKKDPGD